jgi:hypothetical protein
LSAIVFIVLQVGFVIGMLRTGISKKVLGEPLLQLAFVAPCVASVIVTLLLTRGSNGPRDTKPASITAAQVEAHTALTRANRQTRMRAELFGRTACALSAHSRSGLWPRSQSLADCPGVQHDSGADSVWRIAYHAWHDETGHVVGFRISASGDSVGVPISYVVDTSGTLFRADYHLAMLDSSHVAVDFTPVLRSLVRCWKIYRRVYGVSPRTTGELGDSASFSAAMRTDDGCTYNDLQVSSRTLARDGPNLITREQGYRFEIEATRNGATLVAVARPIQFGVTGIRSYRFGVDRR